MNRYLGFTSFQAALRTSVFFAAMGLSAISCSTKKSKDSMSGAAITIPHADTITLETACRILSSHPPFGDTAQDSDSIAGFYQMLDSTAEAIRHSTQLQTGPAAARTAILETVYHSWNVGFDSVDTSLESLLPDRVYRSHKGSCLGTSLLILMLAERLGCPIHGVMLPGHFFCRYDDGKTRINIEPNRSGCEHDDAYYKDRYHTGITPWYDLADLPRSEVIGVACFNLGTLCLRKKLPKPAIGYFRECLHLVKNYPEAKGNLAVAYALSGNRESALTLFAELFAEHPAMPNLAVNYGSVAASAKQYHKAINIYLAALAGNPGDQLLFRRAEYVLSKLGNDDSVKIFWQRLQAFKAMAK